MIKRPQIAKYWIVTSTIGNKKSWFRIVIDGVKTDYEVNKDGYVRNRITHEIIKETRVSTGYASYKFKFRDETYDVGKHRLMACVFIPIPKNLRELGYDQTSLIPKHIDGNSTNNELSNLEWATPSENIHHAMKNGSGNVPIGESSQFAKIDEATATKICELLQDGMVPKDVSNILEVSRKTVQHIYSGDTWKHISKNYYFNKSSEYQKPDPVSESSILEACEMMKHDCELEKQKYGMEKIANKCGINLGYLRDIRNGRRRKELTKDYDFSALRKNK